MEAAERGEGLGLGTVRDVLAQKGAAFYSTRADALVYDAVKQMVRLNIGSLIIVDDEGVATGMVTERDYLERVIVKGRSSRSTEVREIMSSKAFTYVCPSATLTDCMATMTEMNIRHIPVIQDGKVLGLVSVGDIVKELVAAHKKHADQMESYLQGSY